MMKKTDALARIFFDKTEILSYTFGDSNGGFSTHDMEDLEALIALTWVANGRRIYKAFGEEIVMLFKQVDPYHQYVNADDVKAYNRVVKMVNRLVGAMGGSDEDLFETAEA